MSLEEEESHDVDRELDCGDLETGVDRGAGVGLGVLLFLLLGCFDVKTNLRR